jgi:periplasmic divalent cation tolerance protein
LERVAESRTPDPLDVGQVRAGIADETIDWYNNGSATCMLASSKWRGIGRRGGLPYADRGGRMTEFLQVTTTVGTRQDAERIAAQLVEQRLAGCVQINGPIQSTYRWQGAVETTEEWTCVAKTCNLQFAAIERLLADLHPYDVPELVATPITAGSDAYLKWLKEQLGGT